MTINKTFFALILSAMILVPFTTSAQVTIGSGRVPSEWSLLDLCTDVQRKALHNARMTYIQRNALMSPNHSPEDRLAARGLLIFHLDAIAPGVGCLEFWNGIKWVSLCEDILPPALATSHPMTATICHGDTHTFTLDAATGGSGAITYQWQSSTDGTTWVNITNATGQNLTTPALTANTHFRRIAVAACGSSIESNGALVTVHPELTTPHPANVTICHRATHTFTLAAAAGGSGEFTYQWQQSANGGVTWTNIFTGAASADYTTPALTANRHYRRLATCTICGTIESNAALVTVTPEFTQPNFNPTRYWTVQGARHNITLGPAEGGSGTLTYQWQHSLTGAEDSWANIPGATGQNFHTPAFQNGSRRFFRRQATRTTCGGTITSNTFEIVVVATHNVNTPGTFVTAVQNTGMLYQWGRRVGWSAADPRTSSPANQTWADRITSPSNNIIGGFQWTDAANPCPTGWVVPIRSDFNLIRENTTLGTTRQRLNVGGVEVWRFTNSQGAQFTIPIVPQVRRQDDGRLTTINAGYWLRVIRLPNSHMADAFEVTVDVFGWATGYTNNSAQGLPVRCVLR